jgi:hypothetical protein
MVQTFFKCDNNQLSRLLNRLLPSFQTPLEEKITLALFRFPDVFVPLLDVDPVACLNWRLYFCDAGC